MSEGRVIKLVRVPVYWLVVGLAVSFLSPILSVWASVQIANHNRERAEQAAAKAQIAAQTQAREQSCKLLDALLDVYIDDPPTSDTGRSVQQAYLLFYNDTLHCTPHRDK